MKKLIFGLILSVGISGMGLANTQVISSIDNHSTERIQDNITNSNEEALKKMGCAIGTKTIASYCDGAYEVVTTTVYDTPCGDNADGTFIMMPAQTVDMGCNE